MATTSKTSATRSLQSLQKEAERLYRRLRKDAEGLLARGRKEFSEDVRGLQRRAVRATRDLEASLLRRMHAASEAQLKRLERRLTIMEKRVADLERSGTAERGAA
jgi:hypothetical protein